MTIKLAFSLDGLRARKLRPSSESYFAVKESVDDQLILPKLHFFSYVAGIVELVLKAYQTDNPMIPYLYFVSKAIIKQLLELIVENNVIDGSL